MIIDSDEQQLPILPLEIIQEIVSYIPITTELRTHQAFLVTHTNGLFYISNSCKAFLSMAQCYVKCNFVFSDDENEVAIFQTISIWLKLWSLTGFRDARNSYHFHHYVDRCLNDKEVRLSPFLSFLRITLSYINKCTAPSLFGFSQRTLTPVEYTLNPETTIGFVYYADNENIVRPLRLHDDIMVLQKTHSDWKKTLNYGGWLTRGRYNDPLERVVYKGKFLLDPENYDFRSRCFYFANDRDKAQIAFQFYNSAKEGPFHALLNEYYDQ